VIGHVAAAIDLVNGDAAPLEQLLRGQNVGSIRVAPQREHRRMLQQQQHILRTAFGYQPGNLRLQAQPFVVIHAPEIEVLNHRPLDCNEAGKTGKRNRSGVTDRFPIPAPAPRR
jgi:hypothetical protein